MARVGKEDFMYYLPLVLLSPSWMVFIPYAIYADTVQAKVSLDFIGTYTGVALPSFVNILSSNWMILKAIYDDFGGLLKKK